MCGYVGQQRYRQYWDFLQFTAEHKQEIWASKEAPLTAASVSELCLGLENAQHNVSATSCVLLCMQNSSTVSVQHMCAPMQHSSAVYWQEKGWDLDFGCFMVLSPSHLHSVCYRGCAFTGKIQIQEKYKCIYRFSYPQVNKQCWGKKAFSI